MFRRCCCGGTTANCDAGRYTILPVSISGTGTALDGDYQAEWAYTNDGWYFDAGGCEFRVVPESSLGNIAGLATVPSNGCTLTGNCEYVGGKSEYVIEPDDDMCDWCGLGDLIGGTISIGTPLGYPEYVEILTPFTDNNCDCSAIEGLKIPIYCAGSNFTTGYDGLKYDIPNLDPTCSTYFSHARATFGWYFPGNNNFSVQICLQTFVANTKLSEFASGSDIILSPFANNTYACGLQSSLTIRTGNNGYWC